MMDNVVDYLIVLFFIISFLSSVFKKKKKQAQKDVVVQNKPIVRRENSKKVIEQKTTTSKKSAFEEIFKAILEVPQPVENPKSEVDAYFEEAIKNSEMIEAGINQDAPELKKVHPLERKANTYTDAIKDIKYQHSSRKANKIKERLKNNTTIKEYIIINEVLGKPIALRD